MKQCPYRIVVLVPKLTAVHHAVGLETLPVATMLALVAFLVLLPIMLCTSSARAVEVNDYDERPSFTEPAFIRFCIENELIEKTENPEEYYINIIMQEKIKQYLEYAQNASF